MLPAQVGGTEALVVLSRNRGIHTIYRRARHPSRNRKPFSTTHLVQHLGVPGASANSEDAFLPIIGWPAPMTDRS